MSKQKELQDCRNHDDYVHYSERKGGEVIHGKEHDKVKGPNGGICPLPRHKGDIPIGTRKSINKMLIAIGLGCLPILCVIQYYLLVQQ